jgi:hypothetical protein
VVVEVHASSKPLLAGSKMLPAYLIVSHSVVVQITAGSELLSAHAYLIAIHPVVVQVTAGRNCFPHTLL